MVPYATQPRYHTKKAWRMRILILTVFFGLEYLATSGIWYYHVVSYIIHHCSIASLLWSTDGLFCKVRLVSTT